MPGLRVQGLPARLSAAVRKAAGLRRPTSAHQDSSWWADSRAGTGTGQKERAPPTIGGALGLSERGGARSAYWLNVMGSTGGAQNDGDGLTSNFMSGIVHAPGNRSAVMVSMRLASILANGAPRQK